MRLFFWWYNSRFTIFIHRHIGQRRFGDFGALGFGGVTLHVHFHVHRNRGIADFYDVGIEAHDVSNKQRLLEYERIHCHGRHSALGTLHGGDAARDVHLPHQPAAKNISAEVGIRRHRRNTDGWLTLG